MNGDGAGNFELTEWRVDPEALGLRPATLNDIGGGDAAFNARAIEAVLAGEVGANRDIGLLNAAAALMVAGRADTLGAGSSPGPSRLPVDGRPVRWRPWWPPRRTRWSKNQGTERTSAPLAGLTRQARLGAK